MAKKDQPKGKASCNTSHGVRGTAQASGAKAAAVPLSMTMTKQKETDSRTPLQLRKSHMYCLQANSSCGSPIVSFTAYLIDESTFTAQSTSLCSFVLSSQHIREDLVLWTVRAVNGVIRHCT